MDIENFKVGQIINVGSGSPPYRLILGLRPETVFLGNSDGEKSFALKEWLEKAKPVTEAEVHEFYAILSQKGVVYRDENGTTHPFTSECPFAIGDIIRLKGDKKKRCHKVSAIDSFNKGIFVDNNSFVIPFWVLTQYERLGNVAEQEKENGITLNGERYILVKPDIESCSNCDLNDFCDKFKEALCDMFVGDRGMIFKKGE